MKGAGWEAQKKRAAAPMTLSVIISSVVSSARVMSQPLSREFPLTRSDVHTSNKKSYDCVNHAAQSKDNLVIQNIIVRVLYSLLQSHSS
jgi:Holliday junction resolvase RusA-like endonuclease